ncbi:MAG: FMN-binding negative transcriptional regulator [Hyphomicrobiales bacterium]
MHPNPTFRNTARDDNIAFARERSFGTLAVNADDGPLLSHIPFQVCEEGTRLEVHLVRSNPTVRALKSPKDAVVAVMGPDGYISPDWYGVEDQVPTWNYVAVHLRGRVYLLADDELRGILDRLSLAMETRLLPKKPWNIEKMSDGVFEKLARMIVPITMEVDDIQSTWKLSQNKADSARIGAAQGLRDAQLGSEVERLCALIEDIQHR